MRSQNNNEKIAELVGKVIGLYLVGPAIFGALLWFLFPILAYWQWFCIGIAINYFTKQTR